MFGVLPVGLDAVVTFPKKCINGLGCQERRINEDFQAKRVMNQKAHQINEKGPNLTVRLGPF